ncbi:MAG: bifunctional adenosylcobinamide kinase/adenosylcobinamide-phosphate guanylyltransferase [Spirochaetes bacterium]|nr:bifunctional adenosylcobinamide kinase/adenosylcobinamide-phosphate guanylyltransferase [Spirochaetota bacterium]
MKYLISGGVKSGKSTRALEIARGFAEPRSFLATAVGFDGEMKEKIARHRAERQDAFETVEEPFLIHAAVRERMIVDCIPMWLNNLFFAGREDEADAIIDAFIERLPDDIVIVTNETGMGVIPADAASRRYGELLGAVNAQLAKAVERVELMIAGIPLRIK